MSQHTKIKKGTIMIANPNTTGQTTIDMELSTEDMRKMEQDYNLGAGAWWTRVIPIIDKTNNPGAPGGGGVEEPLVTLSNPSGSYIVVRLNVSVTPTSNVGYNVTLIYPHSIIR
ncbi:MAG: hypothetical protein PHU54_02665 [Candidatus Omnitrophica bacterium]|nr:hypothetical protein [Candidatus Omnitrophota bacterium]